MRKAGLIEVAFAVAALALVSLGMASCKYDPQIDDGALRCSTDGQCPDGYSCRVARCWSGAGSAGDGGLGGDAIPAAVINRYIGAWVFDPTALVATSCDDGYNDSPGKLLSPVTNPEVMVITSGSMGRSDLDSNWLCPALGLRLDATGAHLFNGGANCISDNSQDPSATWSATDFNILSANGRTANHVAFYNRVDHFANGSVVNCGQRVTASLTKR